MCEEFWFINKELLTRYKKNSTKCNISWMTLLSCKSTYITITLIYFEKALCYYINCSKIHQSWYLTANFTNMKIPTRNIFRRLLEKKQNDSLSNAENIKTIFIFLKIYLEKKLESNIFSSRKKLSRFHFISVIYANGAVKLIKSLKKTLNYFYCAFSVKYTILQAIIWTKKISKVLFASYW